jgi:hypothetical protein
MQAVRRDNDVSMHLASSGRDSCDPPLRITDKARHPLVFVNRDKRLATQCVDQHFVKRRAPNTKPPRFAPQRRRTERRVRGGPPFGVRVLDAVQLLRTGIEHRHEEIEIPKDAYPWWHESFAAGLVAGKASAIEYRDRVAGPRE